MMVVRRTRANSTRDDDVDRGGKSIAAGAFAMTAGATTGIPSGASTAGVTAGTSTVGTGTPTTALILPLLFLLLPLVVTFAWRAVLRRRELRRRRRRREWELRRRRQRRVEERRKSTASALSSSSALSSLSLAASLPPPPPSSPSSMQAVQPLFLDRRLGPVALVQAVVAALAMGLWFLVQSHVLNVHNALYAMLWSVAWGLPLWLLLVAQRGAFIVARDAVVTHLPRYQRLRDDDGACECGNSMDAGEDTTTAADASDGLTATNTTLTIPTSTTPDSASALSRARRVTFDDERRGSRSSATGSLGGAPFSPRSLPTVLSDDERRRQKRRRGKRRQDDDRNDFAQTQTHADDPEATVHATADTIATYTCWSLFGIAATLHTINALSLTLEFPASAASSTSPNVQLSRYDDRTFIEALLPALYPTLVLCAVYALLLPVVLARMITRALRRMEMAFEDNDDDSSADSMATTTSSSSMTNGVDRALPADYITARAIRTEMRVIVALFFVGGVMGALWWWLPALAAASASFSPLWFQMALPVLGAQLVVYWRYVVVAAWSALCEARRQKQRRRLSVTLEEGIAMEETPRRRSSVIVEEEEEAATAVESEAVESEVEGVEVEVVDDSKAGLPPAASRVPPPPPPPTTPLPTPVITVTTSDLPVSSPAETSPTTTAITPLARVSALFRRPTEHDDELTFDQVMLDPTLREDFKKFCMSELSVENVLFFEDWMRMKRRLSVVGASPSTPGRSSTPVHAHLQLPSMTPPMSMTAASTPTPASSPARKRSLFGGGSALSAASSTTPRLPPPRSGSYLHAYENLLHLYILPNSQLELNLLSATRAEIIAKMEAAALGDLTGVDGTLFDKAADEARQLMLTDTFPRYVRLRQQQKSGGRR